MIRTTSEEKVMAKSSQAARRKRRNRPSIKTAVLATGRWQPPHVGHALLINKAYEIAKARRGHVFVFVCGKPVRRDADGKRQKLTIAEENRNPLNIDQKIKYLKKMFSPEKYPQLPVGIEFLTTESFDYKKTGPKGQTIQLIRGVKHGTGFTGITSYLKERGYEQIIVLAGSDRLELFKKINAQYIDAGTMIIEEVGGDRGYAGEGKITMGTCELSNRQCSIYLDQVLMKFYEDEVQQGRVSKYSGTNMRYFADTMNIIKFIVGSKIGDMTDMDCLDLMNDIRKGSIPPLPPISKEYLRETLNKVHHHWEIRKQFHDDPEYLRDLALSGVIDPIYNTIASCGILDCQVHIENSLPGMKVYDNSENPFLHGLPNLDGGRRTRKRKRKRKKKTRKRKRKKTTRKRKIKKRKNRRKLKKIRKS